MNESKKPTDADALRSKVREGYTAVARGTSRCCGGEPPDRAHEYSKNLGYTDEELAQLPEGANIGAGCGNPTATAEIRPGDVVLDLGSGAGIDCFLAAKQVGPEGRVIGVDMTDEMLERARANAAQMGVTNVEFRKGLIEQLPVEDESVDLIVSNCVINLSPQKDRVFAEAFRVLKPGGRMLVSDIVLEEDLPPEIANDLESYVGCIAGAIRRDAYMQTAKGAGFDEVDVLSAIPVSAAFGKDESELRATGDRLGIDLTKVKDHLSKVVSVKLRATRRA